MLKYIDFINRLEELDIKLYDFQKRISFIRLSNLKNESLNQTGGSYQSVIYKIGKVELENIILHLLDKNYTTADKLCEYFCK